jgi:hypothetical protein
MCTRCEGASRDEELFGTHGMMARHGWQILYVEHPLVSGTWAYSIGISAGFAHPELAVVGVEPRQAAALINGLGDLVRSGVDLTTDNVVLLEGGGHLHLSPVHPAHFETGTFAAWNEYYDALGGPMPTEWALEIVPPGHRPRLNIPTQTGRPVPLPRPNRRKKSRKPRHKPRTK